MKQKHNGWTNEATSLLAEWISNSHLQVMIRQSGADCMQISADNDVDDRQCIVDALPNLFAERMPHVLSKRLTSLIKDGTGDDPDSFAPVLAVIGFDLVDWKQIALHWAEVITPGAFDDDASGELSDDPFNPYMGD